MCKDNFRRLAGLVLTLFIVLFSLKSQSNISEVFENPLMETYIPDQITVNIDTANYRKYKLNVLRGFYDSSSYIPDSYKKEVHGQVETKDHSGEVSTARAKIRITGDYADHIRLVDVVSSLHIKLKNGNLSGITKFKLLLPGTRNSHHEVFITVLLEKLGVIAPYTKIVSANINGYKTPMLFQEVPEKELLERFSLREAPIIEGDERQYYTNYSNSAGRSVCCTARIDNGKWLSENSTIRSNMVQNALSLYTSMVLTGNEDKDNSSHHEFNLVDTSFREIMLFLGANHGLSTHNRKFYYDPIYNILRPIYYDGDPSLDTNYKIILNNISNSIRNKILKNDFISSVLDEYILRAGPIDESSLNYLENLEGKRILRLEEMKVILEKLVMSVRGLNADKNVINKATENLPDYMISSRKLTPVLFDKFDKRNPYLFVTNDIDSGKHLLCIKRTSKVDYNFKDIEFDNNLEFNCNEVGKDLYDKAIKGSLSYKVSHRPFKIHVQTPGLMYIDDVNEGYFDIDYLNNIVINDKKIKNKMSGFTGAHIAHSNGILFPEQKFSSKLFHYPSSSISNSDNIRIGIDTTHYIYFDNSDNEDDTDSLNFLIERNSIKSGRVVLLGDLSRIRLISAKSVEVKNGINSTSTKEVFDDRLLTGCVTILDAKVNNLKIESTGLNCEDSINILRTIGNGVDITIFNAESDGLDVDFSSIKFNSIRVDNAGNDCIDLSAGDYIILNATVQNCGDKGVSVGEKSTLVVRDLIIDGTFIGVASKDSSSTTIDSAIINNSEKCLSSYNKKSEFEGGYIAYSSLNNYCNNRNYFDTKSTIIKLND